MSAPLDLKRLHNWRGNLAAALMLDGDKAFKWGEHDCFFGVVVPAIVAITGVDISVMVRAHPYTNAQEARANIRAAGFRNIADVMATLLPEIHPSKLHIGDVAAVDSGDGWLSLGVCTGERIVVLSPACKGTVSLLKAKRGFKVG